MKTAAALLVLAVGASTAHASSDEPEANTVVITEKGSPFWAGVSITTGVVSLGLISAAVYYHVDWQSDVDNIQARKATPGPITQDDCGQTGIEDQNGVFTRLCDKRDLSKTLLLAGALTIPVVAISAYFGFVHVTKRDVRRISVVPTVTTETAGLTLDVRW